MTSPHKIFLSLSFVLVLIAFGTLMYYDVHWFLAYAVAINLVTMILYLYDKSISHTGVMRVPEKVLHALSVLGGSPGALLSQKLFRHKTQKTSFQIVQWFIVLLQVSLLAWISYNHYFV